MELKNQILEFLNKDKIRNINMINFIDNYPVHLIDRVGNSVISKGTSDKNWIYISSQYKDELEIIKNGLVSDDKSFAAIEEWMIPVLTRDRNIKWKLSTMKLILPDDTYMPEPSHETSTLLPGDAEFVYNNSVYKDAISIEYVADRIANGLNSCIRLDGRPIAWAITQDDNAVGFLHVLPEYRRKGYAASVTIDLIRKVRNSSRIPFVHIEQENERSMALAEGLGFKKDRVVSWFEIE